MQLFFLVKSWQPDAFLSMQAHRHGEDHLTRIELCNRAEASGLSDHPIFGKLMFLLLYQFPELLIKDPPPSEMNRQILQPVSHFSIKTTV